MIKLRDAHETAIHAMREGHLAQTHRPTTRTDPSLSFSNVRLLENASGPAQRGYREAPLLAMLDRRGFQPVSVESLGARERLERPELTIPGLA